jgi:hypothetical protein
MAQVVAEERSFPSAVIGPRERATLARGERIRLSELIPSIHRIQPGCLAEYVNLIGFNQINVVISDAREIEMPLTACYSLYRKK